MRADDKKIKKALKELKIPVSYEERVDDLLASLRDDSEKEHRTFPRIRKNYGFRVAVCALCICVGISVVAFRSSAGLWMELKKTLMDFLGFTTGEEAKDNGIDSNPLYVSSKKDLIVELMENVVDAHNIYLLVKITAPTDIAFSEKVGFDYFGFCSGQNYDVNHLLGSSKDCKLLESIPDRPNEALYVVSVNLYEEIAEDSPITCFLQDLTYDPYGEERELLVEGIWSLTFPFCRSVAESVTVEPGADKTFPFIDGSATVESIELTPMGMSITLDISTVTYDLIGISDNTVAVKLVYIDGSEKTICSHDPEENFFQGGGNFIETKGDKVTEQQNFEFTEVLNIEKVIGFYIEDLFLPIE